MITGFDHVVIAVRELETAIQCYRRLGFEVRPGGRHPGMGTQNALIHFDVGYMELLAFPHPAEAIASGVIDQELLTLLDTREAILFGYALTTTMIQDVAEQLLRAGLVIRQPFTLQRLRPDGQQLSWRLLIPGDRAWRRPWPFLIERDEPSIREEAGTHANGVSACHHVALVVRNLEQVLALYQQHLGLELQCTDRSARLGTQRVTFGLEGATIDLLAPGGVWVVQETLSELGEGPLEIGLTSHDVAHAQTFFTQHGIAFEREAAKPETLLLSGEATLGIRLVLTAEKRLL